MEVFFSLGKNYQFLNELGCLLLRAGHVLNILLVLLKLGNGVTVSVAKKLYLIGQSVFK